MNPFWLGVLSTLGVEALIVLGLAGIVYLFQDFMSDRS